MADVIVIEPGRLERDYWLDLWRYRELFRVLAWRDLAVRYKQTVIGVTWAVIRPLLGRIAKLPTEGDAPYPMMVFAGMLPWTFFATGLSEPSNSLINNANLISKLYFPRLIVPTATVVVAIVDFLIPFCDAGRLDGIVPVPAGPANAGSARLRYISLRGQHGACFVDHRAQCQVPRFPLRDAVDRAIRPLCLAGRVQFDRRPEDGGCSIR
jgi:hypothetical protein